jgi:hypothetical protein
MTRRFYSGRHCHITCPNRMTYFGRPAPLQPANHASVRVTCPPACRNVSHWVIFYLEQNLALHPLDCEAKLVPNEERCLLKISPSPSFFNTVNPSQHKLVTYPRLQYLFPETAPGDRPPRQQSGCARLRRI